MLKVNQHFFTLKHKLENTRKIISRIEFCIFCWYYNKVSNSSIKAALSPMV